MTILIRSPQNLPKNSVWGEDAPSMWTNVKMSATFPFECIWMYIHAYNKYATLLQIICITIWYIVNKWTQTHKRKKNLWAKTTSYTFLKSESYYKKAPKKHPGRLTGWNLKITPIEEIRKIIFHPNHHYFRFRPLIFQTGFTHIWLFFNGKYIGKYTKKHQKNTESLEELCHRKSLQSWVENIHPYQRKVRPKWHGFWHGTSNPWGCRKKSD